MLQKNSPAHLGWEVEVNPVGIAMKVGTISVSDKNLKSYF